jgi:hypothetical protein
MRYKWIGDVDLTNAVARAEKRARDETAENRKQEEERERMSREK